MRPDIECGLTLSFRIHVIAHAFRMEVLFPRSRPIDISEAGFAALIKEAMGRHHQEVNKARKLVTHWHSFLNPLSHMIGACEGMLASAKALDETLVKSRKHPETAEEIRWHEENHDSNSGAASQLASCCLSVRMMAPVLAEMFINLFIFNRYKGDWPKQRDKDHYVYGPILDRLARLHAECNGLSGPVDKDNPAVKGFTDLMNRRNDLLHGNIRPSEGREDEFLRYDDITIIKEFRSIYDRSIGPVINAFPLAQAEADYKAAMALLEYLLELMEPGDAEVFRPMLGQHGVRPYLEGGRN